MKFVINLLCLLAVVNFNNADIRYPSHWVEPTQVRTQGLHQEPNCAPCPETSQDCTNDCKYTENDVTQIVNFYKRLISMLGNAIHRNRGFSDKPFELRVKTGVTESERETLKQFGSNKEFNGDALRKVDNVISDILYESKQNSHLFDESIDLTFAIMLFFSSPQNLMFLFATFCIFLTYRLIYVKFSVLRALSLLFLNCTILGFVWTWYHLVEEAEIRLTADRMQYPIPPECNAMELSLWERWVSNSNVDCHKYVRAHKKNAVLEITPQIVIAEMFGQSFSHIFHHFIHSITSFITQLYSILPWPINILAFPFLLIFVMIVVMQWSVLLSGVRFKLNLFHLINYEVGSRQETRTIPDNLTQRITEGTRQQIEEVRPESLQETFQENTGLNIQPPQKSIEPKLPKLVSFAESPSKEDENAPELLPIESSKDTEETGGVSHIEEIVVEKTVVGSPCVIISDENSEVEFRKKTEIGSGDRA